MVRALGTSGAETIQLRINNTTLATWTLTTNWTNYTYTPTDTITINTIEVHFVNDAPGRDVRIDHLTITADNTTTTYQTEDPATVSVGTMNSGTRSSRPACLIRLIMLSRMRSSRPTCTRRKYQL